MITTRSSILMVVAAVAFTAGILKPNEAVALAGLTVLIWLAIQWMGIQWALRSSSGIIRDVKRLIDGSEHDYHTFAVDQVVEIQVTGKLAAELAGFRISIRDATPAACQVVDGYTSLSIDKSNKNLFSLVYKFRPVVCGRMEMAGIIVAIGDPNGLFTGQRFIPLPHKITVLPYLIRPQTTNSVLKNNNLQRILGHHRHRSPGISAELLGIRDYQPGDPPRTIAWKPTARLGKLMSREFETEVPVRATLLCDLGSCQFHGRPAAAVADRVITSVASMARLLLSDRDPVAMVLATEKGSVRIPHGQGERHLARLMHYLIDSADPNPRVDYLPNHLLTQVVFRESFRRFPHLYDRRTNFVPSGRTLLKPIRYRQQRMKCRMAPVLCEVLDLPPGNEFRLIYDADAMRDACMAYVRKHPINDMPGNEAPGPRSHSLRAATNTNLTKRLMEARSRARDNELFILVASLPMNGDNSARLGDVIRVCRAAGHRVILVDAGYPSVAGSLVDPVATKFLHAADEDENTVEAGDFRDELISLGVRYSKITDPKLMERVAIEVELIRSGKMRVGLSRSVAGSRN